MKWRMSPFTWVSVGAAVLVVAAAAVLRGRFYAVFAAVLLGIHTAVSVSLFDAFAPIAPVYVYLQATVYLHFASLIRARLRPLAFRALVSVPASFFVAGTFLGVPFAVALALGAPAWLAWFPYALAGLGLLESLRHRPEELDITLDRAHVPSLRRHPHGEGRVERPLRIVQITDPHLGPFMSEGRLRGLAERAARQSPDLVLLTGDFITMESHDAGEALTRALSPLAALPGRVFACMGNHDHEAPETVRSALRAIGATLLVDQSALVDTGAGPVQVLGLDFHFRERARRTKEACARNARVPGALRLVLLHDPGAFVHLPDGDADLVLSGHTHGGQLGLVSLGLRHTIVSALTKIPDHGLWARGTDRLYVHRGTGHYGFPLRLGVPAEESLLRIHAPGVL
jgi:predicted MPP superfamily phosphohydrolase